MLPLHTLVAPCRVQCHYSVQGGATLATESPCAQLVVHGETHIRATSTGLRIEADVKLCNRYEDSDLEGEDDVEDGDDEDAADVPRTFVLLGLPVTSPCSTRPFCRLSFCVLSSVLP